MGTKVLSGTPERAPSSMWTRGPEGTSGVFVGCGRRGPFCETRARYGGPAARTHFGQVGSSPGVLEGQVRRVKQVGTPLPRSGRGKGTGPAWRDTGTTAGVSGRTAHECRWGPARAGVGCPARRALRGAPASPSGSPPPARTARSSAWGAEQQGSARASR